MKPHAVFEGACLRATAFRPRRRKLLATFRQRVGQPGQFDDARSVMGFLRAGFSHLHLQSRENDWFINSDTEALEEQLAHFVSRYEEVVAMGFSMGGYGALRFASVLKVQRMLAISPQVSIDRSLVAWDKRYRAEARGWDGCLGALAGRGTNVRGAVLVDPFKPLDLRHGRMICELYPHLTLVMLPNGGHPATRAMREDGRFDWLKTELAGGLPDPRAIGQMHRAVRHRSESYWQHLAQQARWRDREALAVRANTRAQAMSQGT
ncbi:alpha/beta hydrolase [Sagittula sp. NFXS13]|uniref:alpha/beta fold hydrolase n=1 Tax=Sagittula sp. NFXS13 TaxID=2819095 RepID=UPI0032DFCDB8